MKQFPISNEGLSFVIPFKSINYNLSSMKSFYGTLNKRFFGFQKIHFLWKYDFFISLWYYDAYYFDKPRLESLKAEKRRRLEDFLASFIFINYKLLQKKNLQMNLLIEAISETKTGAVKIHMALLSSIQHLKIPL